MNFKDVQIGDRVRVTLTHEGTVQAKHWDQERLIFDDKDHKGSLEITALPLPKPKVGAVIDGRRLRNTMWKRGTTIHRVQSIMGDSAFISGHTLPLGVKVVLTAKGFWLSLDDLRTFGFERITDSDRFALDVVPE